MAAGASGLYYNRFRYYDPESGQYASQDPIRTRGGLKLHTYVHDVLTWTDPSGLLPWVAPTDQGHHLVPKGKARSVGWDHLASETDTPTFFFSEPYEPGAHEAVHRAQRPHVGRLQGPWNGTGDDLLVASRAGLKDVSHIRGDLKIPRTQKILAKNVTPDEAFDVLARWHKDQLKKRKPCK